MAEFLDYPGLEHFYKLLKAEIDSASLSDRFTLGYETQEVGSQSYTVVTVWDQGDVNVGETSALFVDYTQKMVALPEGREATANDAKGWADVTIRFVATSDFDIQFNQVIHATGGIRCETGNEYLLKILGQHVILRTLKDWMDAEPSPEPIDPTNGTLAISGNLDLSEDFKVNGNVTVSGNVTGTGTLSATGTITVSGSTEATVNAGATLDECDISIDNGTTTFNSDTTVADGKVSVGGTGVTNAADCVVYCDMEIESSAYAVDNTRRSFIYNGFINIIACVRGFHNGNGGTITLNGRVVAYANVYVFYNDGGSTTTITGEAECYDAQYGIENFNSSIFTVTETAKMRIECVYGIYNGATFIVDGAITVNDRGNEVTNLAAGTITGSGTITVNGEPYEF